MAHNKQEATANSQQSSRKVNQASANSASSQTASSGAAKKGTPMIVERVNRIPVVNFAVSMGFSQYDRLKSSSVTVGDVFTRAESWAAYVWEKVQPIVDKLQDPINKADQLACHTLDFVEDKLSSMKITQSLETIVTKCRAVAAPAGSVPSTGVVASNPAAGVVA